MRLHDIERGDVSSIICSSAASRWFRECGCQMRHASPFTTKIFSLLRWARGARRLCADPVSGASVSAN